MKEIKIGLINLYNIDNYGANLMAFALRKELSNLLPDVESTTVNYSPKQLNEYNLTTLSDILEWIKTQRILNPSFSLSSFLTKQIRMLFYRTKRYFYTHQESKHEPKSTCRTNEREKRFTAFRNDFLNLSRKIRKSSDIKTLDCNAFIIGSDVVWKPKRLIGRERKVYFGMFCKRFPKIAYSTSVGVDDITILERLKKRYSEAINNFSFLSMRESETIEFFKGFCNKEITHCVDPTLLCSRKDYDDLLVLGGCEDPLEKWGYVYVYLLGDNMEAYKFADSIAQKHGDRVLHHTNKSYSFQSQSYSTKNDGPVEFINRIKFARFVITDSFHGTIFSIIYGKQFFSFSRGNMSMRLKDFLDHIGMEDRLIDNDSVHKTGIEKLINYNKVYYQLSNWKNQSKDYLRTSINLLKE